jgi:3-hydroxyacyl-[acyl-carrier-protein] dehydratase
MLIDEIKKYQNNRYPLLFIDRITDVTPGVSATAIKCYSYNEWFFPAHFEDEPNVPGFVLVESMVQTFIMTFLTLEEHKGKKTSFINIDKVKFFKQVIPGDRLKIDARLISFKRGIAKGSVRTMREEEIICKAEFVVALPNDLISLPKNS